MVRLIYFSTATNLMSQEELLKILEVSRVKNKENDITGMLLYLSGNFIQVLEGERNKVDETFKRIEKDSRHHGCIVADENEITQRSFGEWSMGFKYFNDNAKNIEGFSEFINKKLPAEKVVKVQDEAIELLHSFKSNNIR